MPLDWLDAIEQIKSDVLTVDIQSATNLNDDDRLLQNTLMPREDVGSTEIAALGGLNWRPVSDRRTWEQRGRNIPLKTPDMRLFEIEPIESYYTIGEREMNKLRNRFRGARQLMAEEIGADIPSRTRSLAAANYRRIEMDLFEAWVNGTITARNPENGESYTLNFGYDAARYEVAGTAWTAANAYNSLISWIGRAQALIGPLKGIALDQRIQAIILASAPNMANGESMSLANLADRISQDTQSPFQFFNMSMLPPLDVFTDGGTATVATSRWPDAKKIAAVPADNRIGKQFWAPVARAQDIAESVPEAGIDVNGMTAYTEIFANGRGLTTEVQGNVLPVPAEKRVAVLDTGFAG